MPKRTTRALALAGLVLLATARAAAAAPPRPEPASVRPGRTGGFPLIADGRPATLVVDAHDQPGVMRAARDVADDLGQVAGAPARLETAPPKAGPPKFEPVVLAGTLGHNAWIDALVRERRLDVRGVAGRWEAFVVQTVDHPAPGIGRALVIAGADRRGTIFGLYDLSRRMGVSPWAWWADAPVPHRPELVVKPGRRIEAPAVKYRGIFLNDENPSMNGWALKTFGGFNHRFYARVFSLILRLKGNFLWPAMWDPKAFDVDDPDNAKLADSYGVVMGTSHHEPMMRAHAEWAAVGGGGSWDYTKNAPALQAFWRGGVRRMGSNESLVTIGMRGDGDEPMTSGTATALLERIVADQRRIIAEATGKPASETPQVWALYKEVQDYYDKGMRVPDDVTLLFSDDNWGNIRRLPAPGTVRAGGYGVYYHFDYVGDPRNYKWINTNQVERTWEQMHLAHAYGADQLWIVNVGDLKPMELPMSFFLDYAWSPERWPVSRVGDYTRAWAAEQFGPEHAGEIAELLTRYTQWNARRKPELLDPDTFSLTDYREAERVSRDWDALAAKARALRPLLPPQADDAYVELVLYPVEASANLNRLYYVTALNRLHAAQGRADTDALADEAASLFRRDAELAALYNHGVAHGKWDHMMDQAHIGYTGWQEPPADVLPKLARIGAPGPAGLGVAVEGDLRGYANGQTAQLPRFSRYGAATRLIEVFGRGRGALTYSATSDAPWLRLSPRSGSVGADTRLSASVDWAQAPPGRHSAKIAIHGSDGASVTVMAEADATPPVRSFAGFVESDGVVTIEAGHGRSIDAGGVRWREIPNLGRTLSGVTSFPVTAAASTPGPGDAHIDYPVFLTRSAAVRVQVTTAPSLDFRGQGGLRYAVSVDAGRPVTVNLEGDASDKAWREAVSDNARRLTTPLGRLRRGPHVLRLWRIDPGVVFERVVLDAGGLRPSNLGPPESMRRPASAAAG